MVLYGGREKQRSIHDIDNMTCICHMCMSDNMTSINIDNMTLK